VAPERDGGPGIVKVRGTTAVTRRTLELVAVREGWWSRMLDAADVISEGAPVDEARERVYYGTTSLHCNIEDGIAAGGADDAESLAKLVMADPHARLKILRVAYREAVVRAGAPIGVMQAELAVASIADRGRATLSIIVDVSASVDKRRRRRRAVHR
jgi:hypothetical protein